MERQNAKGRGERQEPDQSLDDLAHRVIGAAIQVHRVLGPGLPEGVYESALCVQLTRDNIPYVRQKRFEIIYENVKVGEGRMDLVIAERLVVEAKAMEMLMKIHQQQLLSYLRANRLPLGLLINFNVVVLRDGLQRIVNFS